MTAFNPQIMKSVEKLNYRVTVGDVASDAGLELNLTQQGLLALASDAGGHLQVSEEGEVVYLFPQNYRTILRNKYWLISLQEKWAKISKFLFYLVRISFGIVLIISIILMVLAIIAILIALNSSRDDNSSGGSSRSRSGGGGSFFMPHFWISPDIFWIFTPDYHSQRRQRLKTQGKTKENEMNFLEAIFSFLFGDGDPNEDLEKKRWQQIGTVIRNNKGAIIAPQVAPYLDEINAITKDEEDYVLPVLSKFNGYPQVSPQGDLIYYFPELQVSAEKQRSQAVSAYLREEIIKFSQASGGQKALAVGLGVLNFVLAIILGVLLQGEIAAELGGLVAFVHSIFFFLLAYASAFVAIPVVRYFWLTMKNAKIQARNEKRQALAVELNKVTPALKAKMNFAQQFAQAKVISQEKIAYSTEKDLLEQDLLEKEFQKRLDALDNN
jgi:flagellar basal body-associated protein FliL